MKKNTTLFKVFKFLIVLSFVTIGCKKEGNLDSFIGIYTANTLGFNHTFPLSIHQIDDTTISINTELVERNGQAKYHNIKAIVDKKEKTFKIEKYLLYVSSLTRQEIEGTGRLIENAKIEIDYTNTYFHVTSGREIMPAQKIIGNLK
jgi:hypothetical protein